LIGLIGDYEGSVLRFKAKSALRRISNQELHEHPIGWTLSCCCRDFPPGEGLVDDDARALGVDSTFGEIGTLLSGGGGHPNLRDLCNNFGAYVRPGVADMDHPASKERT